MKNTYKPEGCTSHNIHPVRSVIRSPFSFVGDDKIYEGQVLRCDTELNLWVDHMGIKCIMPKEEVSYLFEGERLKDIAVISRVGKSVCYKAIGFTQSDTGAQIPVLSRRAAQAECVEQYISKLSPGDVIDAKVTHMEQFGAFCDIGCGIISLLSVDCISVSRISHPKDRFECGRLIRAIVKSKSEDGRIYITHKELLGTWEENAQMFSQGQTVSGIVRSVESYGIFVELSPNLAGLAEPKDDVLPSMSAAVYIKSIIPQRMKIKLVLIDAKSSATPQKSFEYIGTTYLEEHIDRWVYSPANSEKTVESVFI